MRAPPHPNSILLLRVSSEHSFNQPATSQGGPSSQGVSAAAQRARGICSYTFELLYSSAPLPRTPTHAPHTRSLSPIPPRIHTNSASPPAATVHALLVSASLPRYPPKRRSAPLASVQTSTSRLQRIAIAIVALMFPALSAPLMQPVSPDQRHFTECSRACRKNRTHSAKISLRTISRIKVSPLSPNSAAKCRLLLEYVCSPRQKSLRDHRGTVGTSIVIPVALIFVGLPVIHSTSRSPANTLPTVNSPFTCSKSLESASHHLARRPRKPAFSAGIIPGSPAGSAAHRPLILLNNLRGSGPLTRRRAGYSGGLVNAIASRATHAKITVIGVHTEVGEPAADVSNRVPAFDDGSTDRTAEVIQKYERRWLLDPAGEPGLYAAECRLARSSGEVMGWLNSSDLLQ